MKRLIRLLPALSLSLLGISACDSATSLDEVSLIGTWDGVGSLQETEDGQGLIVYIDSHTGGSISGTWIRTMGSAAQGTIASGAAEGEEIQFTLQGFPGPDPTFVGGLSDQHRMVGTMNEVELDGTAVFRRRSVDLP